MAHSNILKTAQNVIDESRRRFAEIAVSTYITDADIISWVNQGTYDIVFRTLPPTHEVQNPATVATVAGTSNYALPTDFFRISESAGDASGVFFKGKGLYHESKRQFLEDATFAGGGAGDPEFYWLWSGRLYVWPIPLDVSNLRLYYYRLPVDVTFTTENIDLDMPWRETLVKFVLWKALEKDKHAMSEVYRQQYELALSTMYSEDRTKIEKRARYVHSHDF